MILEFDRQVKEAQENPSGASEIEDNYVRLSISANEGRTEEIVTWLKERNAKELEYSSGSRNISALIPLSLLGPLSQLDAINNIQAPGIPVSTASPTSALPSTATPIIEATANPPAIPSAQGGEGQDHSVETDEKECDEGYFLARGGGPIPDVCIRIQPPKPTPKYPDLGWLSIPAQEGEKAAEQNEAPGASV